MPFYLTPKQDDFNQIPEEYPANKRQPPFLLTSHVAASGGAGQAGGIFGGTLRHAWYRCAH